MNNTDAITKFIAYLLTERCLAQNTIDAYQRDLQQFIDYLMLQNITVEDISQSDIKSYLRFMHEQSLTDASRARKVSSLKTFLRYLHMHHQYKDHSVLIAVPKIGKQLPNYLTIQEVGLLLKATQKDTSPNGLRNKMMVYLLYATGLRVSELVELTLDSLNGADWCICVMGKGSKQRLVPINNDVMTMLVEYVQHTRAKIIAKDKVHKNECNWLFPVFYRGKSTTMTRQSFWKILNKLCLLAGIEKKVSPHQLRHSLATHLLKNGADLRSLQMLLGHENIATVQIYTHVDTTFLRDVYDKKHPRSKDEQLD
jgi:integrase/recombinase XerD